MKRNLGFGLLLTSSALFISCGVFAQDTLTSEQSTSVAPSYSAPVQVVPADPDLWRPVSTSGDIKGSIVPPTEAQRIPVFPSQQSSSSSQINSSRTQINESENTFVDQALAALNINENNSYSSNLELRDKRKIGLGAGFGGDTGLFGLKAEYNFEDADGATAGLGWGPGYQAFAINWKHNWNNVFESEFSPYVTAGYSHWFSTGNGQFENSDILKEVLTERQKSERNFSLDFLTGFAGLQYYVLTGEGSGVTFFAELGLMNEVSPIRKTVLTGGVGSTFYF